MITIYLPNTQEVQDLLAAIEDVSPHGPVTSRECIEVQTENSALATFLRSLNITAGAAKAAIGDISERTCKRCGKQFDPLRSNQYTCSKCLSELAKARMAKNKNGQGTPAPIIASVQ